MNTTPQARLLMETLPHRLLEISRRGKPPPPDAEHLPNTTVASYLGGTDMAHEPEDTSPEKEAARKRVMIKLRGVRIEQQEKE